MSPKEIGDFKLEAFSFPCEIYQVQPIKANMNYYITALF